MTRWLCDKAHELHSENAGERSVADAERPVNERVKGRRRVSEPSSASEDRDAIPEKDAVHDAAACACDGTRKDKGRRNSEDLLREEHGAANASDVGDDLRVRDVRYRIVRTRLIVLSHPHSQP